MIRASGSHVESLECSSADPHRQSISREVAGFQFSTLKCICSHKKKKKCDRDGVKLEPRSSTTEANQRQGPDLPVWVIPEYRRKRKKNFKESLDLTCRLSLAGTGLESPKNKLSVALLIPPINKLAFVETSSLGIPFNTPSVHAPNHCCTVDGSMEPQVFSSSCRCQQRQSFIIIVVNSRPP